MTSRTMYGCNQQKKSRCPVKYCPATWHSSSWNISKPANHITLILCRSLCSGIVLRTVTYQHTLQEKYIQRLASTETDTFKDLVSFQPPFQSGKTLSKFQQPVAASIDVTYHRDITTNAGIRWNPVIMAVSQC